MASKTTMNYALVLRTLVFFSGICGIAYEILYSRLLTTYMGDMFHVTSAVLASFLLSLGVGSLLAHRFVRLLPWIEMAIGIYAAIMSLIFLYHGHDLIPILAEVTYGGPVSTLAAVFILLAIPAGLIGFSVPLFSIYLQHHRIDRQTGESFRYVYAIYNFGATLCVLLVEFALLRAFGLFGAIISIAAVNLSVGVALLRIPPPPLISRTPSNDEIAMGKLMAILGVGVASGVFQLLFLKNVNTVFGPYHENFAIVVTTVLAGLALGAYWSKHWRGGFAALLLTTSLGISTALLLTGPWIHGWAALNVSMGVVPNVYLPLKVSWIILLGMIPFALLGALVPVLLREMPNRADAPGLVLAMSSFGNCIGFLTMALLLHERLPDRWSALFTALFLLLLAFVLGDARHRKSSFAVLLVILSVVPAWPNRMLNMSHTDLASPAGIQKMDGLFESVREFRKFDSTVNVVKTNNDQRMLIIDGYLSLTIDDDGRTDIRESIFGAAPAFYSRRHEHALVLGLGIGATASATRRMYKKTTVVEINPIMLQILPQFSDINMNLAEDEQTSILIEDGLTTLAREGEHYDAIINTVTSPLFFSSSKLYTTDFFNMASKRLSPGGVYALWFDAHVGREGMEIIFQSLKESFTDCQFIFLSVTYSQIICGNETLYPRDPGNWSASLTEKFASLHLGLEPGPFISALAFPADRIFERDWHTRTNTFDRPSLEFVMSANLASSKKKDWSPYNMLGVDFQREPLPGVKLSGETAAIRCYAWHILDTTVNCLPFVREHNWQRIPAAYSDRLLDHYASRQTRKDLGQILVYLAEQFLTSGQPQRALRIAEVIEAMPGEAAEHQLPMALLIKVKSLRALKRYIPDDTLARLLQLRPFDYQTREVLAAINLDRGHQRGANGQLYLARLLKTQQ